MSRPQGCQILFRGKRQFLVQYRRGHFPSKDEQKTIFFSQQRVCFFAPGSRGLSASESGCTTLNAI